jgi:hypothetical protein
MTENKLKNLLKKADSNIGPPAAFEVNINKIHRIANRRKIIRHILPSAAAAAVILAVGIWSLQKPVTEPKINSTESAAMQMKIKQFQASNDATIKLVHDIIEQERSQQRLNILKAELASIPNPIEQINEELDRTAFILVYSADKMYDELNLKDSAIETYKRVIKLFPDNRWAQEARQRLEDMKNKTKNNNRSQGDLKWKQQNTLS